MPDVSQASWSETDAANTATPPDGWPENQAPSTVNDCARMMMGAIKRFWNRVNPATASTGSANAYVLTPTAPLAAYATGEVYAFRAGFANTGAATLDISGLGAKPIRKYAGGAKQSLAAGDLQNGQPVQVAYDGTDMVLMIPPALQGMQGRNLAVNGGIQAAQRGAGPFTSATTPANNSATYLIDGCYLLSNGNNIADVAQVANANFASGFGLEFTIRTANTKLGFVWPVENRDIQGVLKAGAAACQLKALQTSGASIGALRLHLVGWSGTADQITRALVSAWNAAGANFTPAASWAILGTATLSLSGTVQTMTLENVAVAASYKNLALFVVVDDTTLTVGDKCVIGDVQLEAGPACTPFDFTPMAPMLERCKRYYQREKVAGAGGTYFLAVATSASVAVGSWQFRPEMRAAPTFGISGTTHFQLETIASTDLTVTGGAGVTSKLADLVPRTASGLITGNPYRVKDNNSGASYFEWFAEL